MRHTLKPISIALALLFCRTALCQEPPSLPRLPRQEPAPETPAPETGAADTSAANEMPAVPEGEAQGVPQAAVADSSAPAAKPAKKPSAFKPGKIVLDRNGRIFLGATAGLLAGVYIAYRVFQKGVK